MSVCKKRRQKWRKPTVIRPGQSYVKLVAGKKKLSIRAFRSYKRAIAAVRKLARRVVPEVKPLLALGPERFISVLLMYVSRKDKKVFMSDAKKWYATNNTTAVVFVAWMIWVYDKAIKNQ